MKRKRYSPLLAGIGASFLLVGFYWIVLVGFESVDYAINQWNTYKYWMIPLVVGFGLQMSLVIYVTRAKGYVNIYALGYLLKPFNQSLNVMFVSQEASSGGKISLLAASIAFLLRICIRSSVNFSCNNT